MNPPWRNRLLLLLVFALDCLGEKEIYDDSMVESIDVGTDTYNESINNSAEASDMPQPTFYTHLTGAFLRGDSRGSREELSEQEDMLFPSKLNLFPDFRLGGLNENNNDFYSGYDSLRSRYAPKEPPSHNQENKYIIKDTRLRELRKEFMYWYFDKGGPNDEGDLQRDIHWSTPQIHKNFNFQLPFFGFRFNYTRLSLNGYLEFSDPPEQYTYPLTFPNKDWPKKRDPSFIGIFFSKCRIGKVKPDDVDQREPGVYFRLERDLETRTDVFGVEVRERLMWDIREGVIGSDSFVPKHAVIVTWKNISFAGGIDNALYKTNTFQMVLATDEVFTYVIFNYKDLQWTTHTEAGGDTTLGEGGTPAYVGFNAGNGTQSFEYKPYSQNSVLRDLTGRGWANGFPGRHIFRIDEKILLGTCNKDIAGANLPLFFAPESGNMLGGTVVNITGPCFLPNMRIKCRFDTEEVIGTIIDKNRAVCVQPYLMAEGYVRFEISVGENAYNWKGKYFVETPATASEKIHFQSESVHEKNPNEITITWDNYNLTANAAASLTISIFGYKETTIRPQLMYIDILETNVENNGRYTIVPHRYAERMNKPELLELEFGFLHINLTHPEDEKFSPVLWSRPIPLAWYFGPQWRKKYGERWSETLCNKWTMYDRYLKNFAADIPICPCSLQHALLDKGRFLPDFSCDKDTNIECFYNKNAVHCVRSGAPSLEGSEQQCCYDKTGYLMLSYDQQWGSKPKRSHNMGFIPWNEANKVPTLSQWFHDVVPFYSCCYWQEEQAVGCETLRFERRPSQDCVGYQSPYLGVVFGDPHFITFDGMEYTFNGKGEFVLVQANTGRNKLNVQGRFEQVPENFYGEVRATMLTAVAAQDNSSAVIEVRLRPREAQWRYRLDVLADGKKIYFDRPSLKVQHFPGVTVYTPTYILNQSEVIIMFPSGAGVEVIENKGYLSSRVYLPWSFANKTRGLLGTFNFDYSDDFVLPDGSSVTLNFNTNDFKSIHDNFGMKWMLEEREESEKGGALFTRDYGRMSSYYSNRTFLPEFKRNINEIIPDNRTYDREKAKELCGGSYQCQYDYALTLNRDFVHFTLNYYDSYINIQKTNQRKVVSCGVLETPRFGRKSNFFFTPGTKVTFECNQDFTLVGDQKRICMPDGRWDVPTYGYTECLRQVEYQQKQGWTAVAFIGGTLIPVMICILIAYVAFYRGREKDPIRVRRFSDRTWHNRSTKSVHSSNSSTEKASDFDTLLYNPKRRLYDRTYRTREPIKGKPLVDFADKDQTLADVSEKDLDAFNDAAFGDSGERSIESLSKPKVSPAEESSERSPQLNDDESSVSESRRNENIGYNELSSESYEDTDSEEPIKREIRKAAPGAPRVGELVSPQVRSSGSSKSSAESYKSASARGLNSPELPYPGASPLKRPSSGMDSIETERSPHNTTIRKSKPRSKQSATVVQTAI
ncbi:hypothetical protein RUM43_006433 [Polyplax serrata]|uniref:Protein mesh n=1 Tax=Polyplax serrata TaxID=468196 RepID=A0AAN8P1B9_POLSC